MKRYVNVTLILILMLLFTGCTQYWYQADKSIDECKADRHECFEELKKYSSNQHDRGEYEFKFMEDCMKQKGYSAVSAVKEKELPLRVRREDPDRTDNWFTKGVAGSLEKEQ